MSIIVVHLIVTDTETGDRFKVTYIVKGEMEDTTEFVEYVRSVINKGGKKVELDFVEKDFLIESWQNWRYYI